MTHFIAALIIIKKLPTRTEILRLLVTAIIQGIKKGNMTKLPEILIKNIWSSGALSLVPRFAHAQ